MSTPRAQLTQEFMAEWSWEADGAMEITCSGSLFPSHDEGFAPASSWRILTSILLGILVNQHILMTEKRRIKT